MRGLAVYLAALCLAGCQWVGGFEDIEVAQGAGAGAGGAGAGAGGAAGSTQEPCSAGVFLCQKTTLRKCRGDGSGFDAVEECASEPLCKTGEAGGKCTPPACGAGSLDPATGDAFPKNRCRGGDVEICRDDQQQYEATDCGAKHCNPAVGQCFELKIDPKEVTMAEYWQFYMVDKPQVTLPKGCEKNERAPDAGCMADPSVCPFNNNNNAACNEAPQTCVDWCDAYEYCASKGKRLCGAVGDGAMVPMNMHDDAGQSEWMNACSSGGQHAWVLGDEWDDNSQGQFCNGNVKKRNEGTGDVFPVGKLAACTSPEGAYKGVYDLTGNVAEWENSCQRSVGDPEATGQDNCRVRGGSFTGSKPNLRCDADRTEKRLDNTKPDVGFRCCG